MKRLILAFTLLLNSPLFAQDCDGVVVEYEDEVTGRAIIYAADISNRYGEKVYTISPMGGKGVINLFFDMKNVDGCIDRNAEIIFLFTDTTRIQVISNSEFNCDMKAAVHMGGVFGKKNLINAITTKKVKKIRIYTVKSYEEYVLNDDDAYALMVECYCLYNYKKK
jgi:hypothetical protein